jgi:hypothetical protein
MREIILFETQSLSIKELKNPLKISLLITKLSISQHIYARYDIKT